MGWPRLFGRRRAFSRECPSAGDPFQLGQEFLPDGGAGRLKLANPLGQPGLDYMMGLVVELAIVEEEIRVCPAVRRKERNWSIRS